MLLTRAPGPQELITFWKHELESFWPEAGELYRRNTSLEAGQMLGIDLEAGPLRLSTGAVVAESTPGSFTILTPQGHMLAGWTRCEATAEAGGTRARVLIEMRASDPIYEMGLKFGGHRAEERFWAELLWNLAARFDERPRIRLVRRRVDGRRQWRHWTNIRHNAGIRTTLRRLRRALTRAL